MRILGLALACGILLGAEFGFGQCVEYTADLHPMNTTEGSPTETVLHVTEDAGVLENERLTTDPSGSRITDTSCEFVITPGTSGYHEVATFHYATEMYGWLQDNGFAEYNLDDLISVEIDANPAGQVNNALYVSDPPSLLFGAGDGVQLQNLQQDRDIAAWNLANHVFGDAPDTSGDALLVYTAHADFWTAAHTNDPHLGNSVCPGGGTVCWTASGLRSVDDSTFADDEKFTNANLDSAPTIQRSMLLSSALWDVYSSISGDENPLDLVRVSVKGIRRFVAANENDIDVWLSSFVDEDWHANYGQLCRRVVEAIANRNVPVDEVVPCSLERDIAKGDAESIQAFKSDATPTSESVSDIVTEIAEALAADRDDPVAMQILEKFAAANAASVDEGELDSDGDGDDSDGDDGDEDDSSGDDGE